MQLLKDFLKNERLNKVMTSISIRSIEILLKKSGCKRVSVAACEELRNYLEKSAIIIGQKSWIYAKHAKRRTVMADDIRLAVED
jgi:histone H3/H4